MPRSNMTIDSLLPPDRLRPHHLLLLLPTSGLFLVPALTQQAGPTPLRLFTYPRRPLSWHPRSATAWRRTTRISLSLPTPSAVLLSTSWYLVLTDVSCYDYCYYFSHTGLLAAPHRVLMLSHSPTLAQRIPSQPLPPPVEICPILNVCITFSRNLSLIPIAREILSFPRRTPLQHLVNLSLYFDRHPLYTCLNSLLLPKNVQEWTSPEPSYGLGHGCISCSVLLSTLHRIQAPSELFVKLEQRFMAFKDHPPAGHPQYTFFPYDSPY